MARVLRSVVAAASTAAVAAVIHVPLQKLAQQGLRDLGFRVCLGVKGFRSSYFRDFFCWNVCLK